MQRYVSDSVIKLIAFSGGALLMAVVLFVFASCSSVGTRVGVQTATASAPGSVSGDFLKRVHFAFGSDELDAEAVDTLMGNMAWLKRRTHEVLVLEGHCDERGDAAFNVQLGDRRARQVKAFLVAHGVDPHRLIMVVSHGEQRPLDVRHRPDAWRQNRRVEFVIR